MENNKRWLPVASLVVAGVSSLLFLAVNAAPSEIRRALVLVVCVGSLIALILGMPPIPMLGLSGVLKLVGVLDGKTNRFLL